MSIKALTVLCVVSIVIVTFLSITNKQAIHSTTEKVVDLIYKYNDINTLIVNAEVLEGMCEPEIFTILDNRSKANVTRRFNTYVTTIPSVKLIQVEGRTATAVVAYNLESNLRDRYIVIEYNKEGKIHDYKEYEFLNKFATDWDYKGDFENSRTGDYHAGEGDDSLTDIKTEAEGD